VRVKLATEGSGRWAKSGGERSKFGLGAVELMRLLDQLDRLGRKDILKLVHFHLGSQITDIRYVKAGLEEIGRYYAELRGMGFDLTHVDVGGGLGVDYDGSRSTRPASMNYSMREYANDVVYTIGGVCRTEGLPMPHLISESGRAITAHHSLLLINVIDVESQIEPVAPPLEKDTHPLLVEMAENLDGLSADRVEEVFHDVVFAKERAQEYFASGVFSLREKANADLLYLVTLNALQQAMGEERAQFPEIAAHIDAELVDRYFCNFSVFQSLPDSWAIDQLFPIMPIHRLNERPTRKGVLADITCDSDGKIDRFVSQRDVKKTLELHAITAQDEYYLAAFLVGAYQETLGDLHNLFGDTHVVHVRFHDDGGGWWIEEVVKGDTANKVLEYMEYDVADLHPALARDCERAVREGRMSVAESQGIKRFYEGELNGYAYLE
jgi:arginine decarboxylase